MLASMTGQLTGESCNRDGGLMVQYGLDSAFAPSLEQAQALWVRGWRFFGGYIGGPRAAHAWSNTDFHRLADVGFTFIPIYVGRNRPWDLPAAFNFEQGVQDGDDSNIRAGACGFDENQAIALDVEANSGTGALGQALLDYVDGWCQQTHAAGHPTIIYTSSSLLTMLGDHFDHKWGAEWVGNKLQHNAPPWGLYDPGEPPPWTFWQFADNVSNGAYDGNSATDDAPLAVYAHP